MSKFNNNIPMVPITKLLEDIVDNRGKSCPTCEKGFPLIATNCIKHTSIYPTFENIRYVSDEVLHNWFRAELKPNDILFVNKGTPGRVCLVPDPVSFCAAQDMIGLRVDPEKIYYKYLFAVLRSEFIQKKIANFHVGIAIPHFKKSDLDNLLIPVPDKKIQVKTGDLFCQLSEKIELNNKINAELEAMAKTLYDYWFLQFEFPNEEGKPYKSSGGKMVWNEELKREIPEGWEVGTLSQIANITMGSSPKGESLNDEKQGIIFYQGKTDFGFRFPVTRMYTISPVKCANIGDILLSVRAPVGSMNIANEKCCIGRGLAAISGKCKSFLYYMMLANQFQFDKYNNGGTTFGAITKDDLFGLKIIVPNNKIIQRFNDKICHMDKLIEKNEKENQELADLRDFLLPLLMNGQVGFKE